MIRYISDTHFGHANIIKYDNRPWKSAQEMDEAMIELWNNHVKKTDAVYHLGDVVWGEFKSWEKILSQLNGTIYFVKGNHDKVSIIENICCGNAFRHYAGEQITVDDGGRHVVLNHCPILCYPNNFAGWYHLYGHVHTSYDYNVILHTQKCLEDLYLKKFKMYNVGASLVGYYPRTLDEIETIFNKENE